MLTLITFIIVLGILVLVHELGHFFTALKLGVDVEEFGIGFPPRLFKIKRKNITYSINLIPIGGFVKIKGESGEDSDDPHSFVNQSTWKKSSILSAGVLMNFLLAFVLFSIGFMIGLPQALDETVPMERIRDKGITIIEVSSNKPAGLAGLQVSDKIIAVNDQPVDSSEEVSQIIQGDIVTELNITVKRGEEIKVLPIPTASIIDDQPRLIGIGMVDTGVVSYGFFTSIWKGLETTVLMTGRFVQAFYNLIVNLITEGKLDASLSGPVGVAIIAGQVARLGFIYVLQFTAILSINLAIINILPFPALDGGRLLFVLAEKITGRKLNNKIEALIHNSGFLLLILVLVFITWRDVIHYGGQILDGVKNIF